MIEAIAGLFAGLLFGLLFGFPCGIIIAQLKSGRNEPINSNAAGELRVLRFFDGQEFATAAGSGQQLGPCDDPNCQGCYPSSMGGDGELPGYMRPSQN